METHRAAQALAEASSSMTRPHDTVGALTTLLHQCQHGLQIEAGGILVQTNGQLELLASSTHQAAELEMHQLHINEGPCLQAWDTGQTVQAHAAGDLRDRWPEFSRTMLAAGFASVHASPLTFNDWTFGAMGLFRRDDAPFSPEENTVAQAFADIATMLLHHNEMPDQHLTNRLREALNSRIEIEQAKGVLAATHNISVAEAFEMLVNTAHDKQQPLTGWASRVISDTLKPPELR